MKCSNCGTNFPLGLKFCTECGAAVVEKYVCDNCGAELDPHQKFCGECGTRAMQRSANDEIDISDSTKIEKALQNYISFCSINVEAGYNSFMSVNYGSSQILQVYELMNGCVGVNCFGEEIVESPEALQRICEICKQSSWSYKSAGDFIDVILPDVHSAAQFIIFVHKLAFQECCPDNMSYVVSDLIPQDICMDANGELHGGTSVSKLRDIIREYNLQSITPDVQPDNNIKTTRKNVMIALIVIFGILVLALLFNLVCGLMY